jgi:hypothetical protein
MIYLAMRKKTCLLFIILLLGTSGTRAQRVSFERDRLPQPVFHAYPGLVDLYWMAWERAWTPARGLPGPVDDGTGARDVAFMALFCKYSPLLFPAIEALERYHETLLDGSPGDLPSLAWVESEHYRLTGDDERLRVLLHDKRFLQRYFERFDTLSPDPFRGLPSLDAISYQALSASCIARLAAEIGEKEVAKTFRERHEALKKTINKHYWNEETGTYHDARAGDPSRPAAKTPVAYRVMLAGIPSLGQARRMAALARDTSAFGGNVPWPSASRDDPAFDPADPLHGAVRVPDAYVAIKALEQYGFLEEADESAYNLLVYLYATFMNFEPHALWEQYDASNEEPAGERDPDRGCSSLAPVALFIENVLGFHRVDAQGGVVEWRKHHRGLHGIKNLAFGDITADIIGDDHAIQVETNGAFTLIVNGKSYRARKGSNTFR